MADDDINQLRLLQQNIQQIIVQKQQFQKQLTEVGSALSELKNTEKTYKLLGNIMISAKKEDIQKDLQKKKEVLDLKFKNFEKQEITLNQKAEELQKKVLEGMKKENE